MVWLQDLNSIHKRGDTLWVGWAGVSSNLIEQNQNKIIDEHLKKLKLSQVRLDDDEINEFYYGMSNKCIWPLISLFY